MTQQRFVLTLENALYAALFGLALGLRLYNLGAHPLNDGEAREALAVWRFLHGQLAADLPLATSPAYFFFTYFNFLIFQAGDGSARLAPALLGAGLALLPRLFRPSLGRGPALITAGLLAVSTTLIAASRSAHGATLAVLALALGVGLLGRFVAGGRVGWLIGGAAALGVGLASGASFLTGLLAAGLVLAAAARSSLTDEAAWVEARSRLNAERLTFLITLGLSVMLVATVGLLYPSGFGALAGSLTGWLAGFSPATDAGRSFLALPAFMLVYDPLILILGVIGAVRAFRRADLAGQLLAGFALITFVFTAFYSGRTLFELVWIITPLAALGARALFEIVQENWPAGEWPLVAVQTGTLTALIGFALINMAQYGEQVRLNGALYQAALTLSTPGLWNLIVAGLAMLVMIVAAFMFALGWSRRATLISVTWTFAFITLAMTVGAGWGLAQVRANDPVELWWPRPAADDLARLVQTLGDVSNFSVGHPREIVVTVQAGQETLNPLPAEEALKVARTSALAWALRDFSKVAFVSQLDPQINSPVVIAPAQVDNPTLGSAYVGQAFPAYRTWLPDNLFWYEQLGWLTFRRAPVQVESVVLWVRQDIQTPQSALPQP